MTIRSQRTEVLVPFRQDDFRFGIRGDGCGCAAAIAITRVIQPKYTVEIKTRRTTPVVYIKGRTKEESAYVTVPPKMVEAIKTFDAGRNCEAFYNESFSMVFPTEFLRPQAQAADEARPAVEQEVRDIKGSHE